MNDKSEGELPRMAVPPPILRQSRAILVEHLYEAAFSDAGNRFFRYAVFERSCFDAAVRFPFQNQIHDIFGIGGVFCLSSGGFDSECDECIAYASGQVAFRIVIESHFIRLFFFGGWNEVYRVFDTVSPPCSESECQITVFGDGHGMRSRAWASFTTTGRCIRR